jgi:hypothetical protein
MLQRWVFSHLVSDKNDMPVIYNNLRRHCSRFIFVFCGERSKHHDDDDDDDVGLLLFKYEGYLELTQSNSSDWIRHSLFNFGHLDPCTIPLSTDFIVQKIRWIFHTNSGRNQILSFGFDLENKLIDH